MAEDDLNDLAMDQMSDKERLDQDLKIVNAMAKWKQKLAKGEHIKVKIVDKGMMPTINMGDIVEVVPVHTSNLKAGALVFFRQNEVFMVRRIIETVYSGRGEFKVKGDNQTDPEPMVPAGNVLGKVITIERDGQRIEMEKTFASTLNQFNKRFGGSDSAKASIELEKGKEMASSLFRKIVIAIENAFNALTRFVDDTIAKITKR